MVISINWAPTTASLTKMHQELTHHGQSWPAPRVDSPLVQGMDLDLARHQWASRCRATYVSAAQAASLLHQLYALGAPVDILSGMAYGADELTRHLTLTVHLSRHLTPATEISLDEEYIPPPPSQWDWKDTFTEMLEFFGFNLAISAPVLDAISAVTSDGAIAELAEAQADSMRELNRFGRQALLGLRNHLPPRTTAATQARLPGLLAAYEFLCHGTAQRLDELAGQEITVETESGNLGTLTPDHLAAIFYHTLDVSIFPLLDELGWQGMEAWHRHYRQQVDGDKKRSVICAVGATME